MKASEYIKLMQSLIEAHGDLQVVGEGDLGPETLHTWAKPHVHTVDGVNDNCDPLPVGTKVMVIG